MKKIDLADYREIRNNLLFWAKQARKEIAKHKGAL